MPPARVYHPRPITPRLCLFLGRRVCLPLKIPHITQNITHFSEANRINIEESANLKIQVEFSCLYFLCRCQTSTTPICSDCFNRRGLLAERFKRVVFFTNASAGPVSATLKPTPRRSSSAGPCIFLFHGKTLLTAPSHLLWLIGCSFISGPLLRFLKF